LSNSRKRHTETSKLQIAGLTWNFAPYGLIFTARKFLVACKATVVQEESEARPAEWHPVGKYLACHSIELSLKSFLTLKEETLSGAKGGFSHNLTKLLQEASSKGLSEIVALTPEERDEIIKASPYYDEKVFEYPSLPEAVRAYPGDPNVYSLVSAAEKLVDGLYESCRAAA
jgi:hypothetical protein